MLKCIKSDYFEDKQGKEKKKEKERKKKRKKEKRKEKRKEECIGSEGVRQ